MEAPTNPSVDVQSVVFERIVKDLEFPIQSLCHADHVVRTALLGYPQLAADHLLNEYMKDKLLLVIGDVIRRLNLELRKSRIKPEDSQSLQKEKIKSRQWAYELLIELALNLIGVESKKVGFSEDETHMALQYITNTLEKWESIELIESGCCKDNVARAVVKKSILDMKKVGSGISMLSKIAEDIEAKLLESKFAASFVLNSKDAIRENIYYKLSVEGLCKFGNDYALGLRWLRHLGFVQVSTNPVLAARAYDDDPNLWYCFKEIAQGHPEWLTNPEMFADDITMAATMSALWPNLTVFRPIALLSRFREGLVSYQLNPNVSGSLEDSVNDALKIYSSACEFLRRYDSYLMWGYPQVDGVGRPNIVFKVACEKPVSIEITTALNKLGIGTNNTVTFSVAQEVALVMAAMRGMAMAKKMGIHVTKVYETNMGGRLENHLREVEAERLLKMAIEGTNNREELLLRLASELGALEEIKSISSFEERLRVICSSRYLKSLTEPNFLEFLIKAGTVNPKEQLLNFLERSEEAIGYAGTLVAQRVYKIFFSIENREKWVEYIEREFALSRDAAEDILDKIDLLPASKRKPSDTLLTLSRKNVTNTEFPKHQLSLLLESQQEGFDFHVFENSITRKHDERLLKRLLEMTDFRKAYELTPELLGILKTVGIEGDFGDLGLRPEEWSTYGPVVKTMSEFRSAYNKFKDEAVKFVKSMSRRST